MLYDEGEITPDMLVFGTCAAQERIRAQGSSSTGPDNCPLAPAGAADPGVEHKYSVTAKEWRRR